MGVDPDSPEDIEAFADIYAQTPDGQIMDLRSAGDLWFALVARLPA